MEFIKITFRKENLKTFPRVESGETIGEWVGDEAGAFPSPIKRSIYFKAVMAASLSPASDCILLTDKPPVVGARDGVPEKEEEG